MSLWSRLRQAWDPAGQRPAVQARDRDAETPPPFSATIRPEDLDSSRRYTLAPPIAVPGAEDPATAVGGA